MRGGTVPHHRMSAYLVGYEEGKREQSYLLPMGMALGLVIGVFLVLSIQWLVS